MLANEVSLQCIHGPAMPSVGAKSLQTLVSPVLNRPKLGQLVSIRVADVERSASQPAMWLFIKCCHGT